MYNTYLLEEDDAALLERVLREFLRTSNVHDPDVATLLKYIAGRGEEGKTRASRIPLRPRDPRPRP
jgi:hypothetical protein